LWRLAASTAGGEWKETIMGKRSEALADTFEKAMADFTAAVEACGDKEWQAICGDEGWTVAATAQHVAGQFPLELEYITAIAEGRSLPSYSWDDINGKNDARAAANTSATKADVLELLRREGGKAASYVRGLSDEQLDNTAALPLAGGATVTTQQLIEGGVLIAHVTGHTASIRSAG
jgi:hypothetical protein